MKFYRLHLVLIASKFGELPDDNMEHIHTYLVAGKPVIGLRTATHAFHYNRSSENKYAKYGYKSVQKGWEGEFEKSILKKNGVSHYGARGTQGAKALTNGLDAADANPVLELDFG